MKKILPCLMLLMLVAETTHAATTYRYSDNVMTLRGDAIGGASVTVYVANTTTKATIYLTNLSAGLTKSNPTYTDGYGRYFFYALPGVYDITISGTNITTYTVEDVRVLGEWIGHETLYDTFWRDIEIPLPGMAAKTDSVPGIVYPSDISMAYSFADTGGQYGYFNFTAPFDWIADTAMVPHAHFVLPDTLLPNATVIFKLPYIAYPYKEAAAFQDTMTVTFTNNTAGRDGIVASALHYARIKPGTHLIAKGASLTGGQEAFYALTSICGRISRGLTDTYNGSVYLIGLVFRYQADRLGSENELGG